MLSKLDDSVGAVVESLQVKTTPTAKKNIHILFYLNFY